MASKQAAATKATQPSHSVYIVEGEDAEKRVWTKIGSAWTHGDGLGFNVSLGSVPLSGRIVLRARKPEAGE
jgi:hypothetical protein